MRSIPSFPPQASEAWYKALENRSNKPLSGTDPEHFSIKEGISPQNISKNRYKEIVPYDFNRVFIRKKNVTPSLGNDFINASHVQVSECSTKYIATQAPLPDTFKDFWLMVYENRSPLIVVLSKELEGTVVKYQSYWPETVGGSLPFPEDELCVELIAENKHPLSCEITFAYFKISKTQSDKNFKDLFVTQIRFEGWPDMGIPSHPSKVTTLIEVFHSELNISKVKNYDAPGPPVIHCSAGVGRTGTFCAIDSGISLLKAWDRNLDIVVHIVYSLRQQRMQTVETFPQFSFIYKVLNYFQTLDHINQKGSQVKKK